MTVDLLEPRPEAFEAADKRALEQLAEGDGAGAVATLRAIVHRAVTKHGEESERTGMTQSPGRNDPCPCGSGRKYRRSCGG